MKRLTFVFLLLFSFLSFADEKDYSVVELSFSIEREIVPDVVVAKFEVYAEGDNYNMALSRMQGVYKDFVGFLKNLFSEKEIKTEVGYSYSNTAKMIVVVKTKDKEKIERAISYVLSKKFPYKTGINIADTKFIVSKEKLSSLKEEIFKEALKEAKKKQKVINEILNSSYKIYFLKLNWEAERVFVEREYPITRPLALEKEKTLPRLELSKGSKKVKLEVLLTLRQEL